MYEASRKIVVLESNATLLAELKQKIEEADRFTVAYAGDDGAAGLKQILKTKPALAVIGTFLKGVDGCNVIREVKNSLPACKIVATGVAGESIIDRAIKEGADYYLIKPFAFSSALDLMEELLIESAEPAREVKEFSVSKRKPVTLEEKISDIFISIGIPPHIKGYAYLREGIRMTVERPHVINNVTKELYPGVAKAYDTTPSKVERAIRHAIEVAWNRGRIDAINAVFGTRVYLGSEKPTNSEFIALVADKLILENMM